MSKHKQALAESGLCSMQYTPWRRFFIVDNGKYAHFDKTNTVKWVKERGSEFWLVDGERIKLADSDRYLDIWDAKKPRLTAYKKTDSDNQRWRVDHANCLFSIVVDSLCYQIKCVPYRLLSYNMAYYVTRNEVNGSEAAMVERCQTVYSGGWSMVPNLSQCTKNAMDTVATLHSESPFDFIGFQELPNLPPIREVPLSYLRKRLGDEFQQFRNQDVLLLARTASVGNGVMFTPPNFNTLNKLERPFLAAWFPSVATVAIVLHAPHVSHLAPHYRIDLFLNEFAPQLELMFAKVAPLSSIKTIVAMGDFNGNIQKQPLYMLGHRLQVYDSKPAISCCFGVWEHAGDLIFTSEFNNPTGRFEVVDKKWRIEPASDHRPVISY